MAGGVVADLVSSWERDCADSRKLLARAARELNSALAPLLVAQAALRRDITHDITVSDRPDGSYGSWIEGVSLLYPLLHNQRVVVDLIACPTVDAFGAKYGVSPAQFSRLAREGLLIVNIRDGVDPSHGADEVRAHPFADEETVGGHVFAALPDECVMVGAVLREAIFTALNRDASLVEEFETALPLCRQWLGELANVSTDEQRQPWYRAALTRAGTLPHERALAYRIAYHACYRHAATEGEFSRPGSVDGTRAMDRFLKRSFADPATLRGRMERAESVRYATLFHHRDTAPLTGAWGGQYAITVDEHEMMRDLLLTNEEKVVLDPEFDEVLAELITTECGDITERSDFAFRTTRSGLLDPEAFDSFLKYKRIQQTSGLLAAQVQLRDAVHDISEERGLEHTASTYRRIVEETADLRYEPLVRFTEGQHIWQVAGGLGGLAMATEAGWIGKIAASWIGALAATRRTKTCHLLSNMVGYKQKHRDIYGAVAKITHPRL